MRPLKGSATEAEKRAGDGTLLTMASTTALATAGIGIGVAAGVYALYKVFDNVSSPAPAMAPTGTAKARNK